MINPISPEAKVMDSPVKASLRLWASSGLSVTTKEGENSSICFFRRSIFLPHVKAETWKRSLFILTTSRVWVPIEPVLPSIANRFLFPIIYPAMKNTMK